MKRDIDDIIEAVRKHFVNAEVHQLQVRHPGDDDGIWFFYFPGGDDIQIESWNGMWPFLVESNVGEAKHARTVDEVVALICDYLSTVENDIPEWSRAVQSFQEFLRSQDWPDAVQWVFRDDILVRGTRVLAGPASEEQVVLSKRVFEAGRAKGLVELVGIAASPGAVLATVWYPKQEDEEVQGWSRGFKLSVRDRLPRATIMPSIAWALIRRTPSYRRCQRDAHFIGTREWAAK